MEGNITHTAIISYSYGTLHLKEGPKKRWSIFSTLYINFVPFFSLIDFSLRDPHYIRPRFFYFCDPISRLHSRLTFRDSTRDSHFMPPLATHISRLHSRLTFVTHIRDSHSRLPFRDSRSRLPFATPIATPVRDSHSQLPFVTVFRDIPVM